jgi:hypothetical protein
MVLTVTIILIVSLTVSLTGQEDPTLEPPDPCCVSLLSVLQRTPALQCLCAGNSYQAIVYTFGDVEWEAYEFVVQLLQNLSYLSEAHANVAPTPCTPEANTLISLAQLATKAGGFEDAERTENFRTLVRVPYLLFMLYDTLDGIHWTNATAGWDEPGAPLQ